jgi:hypothetical protein
MVGFGSGLNQFFEQAGVGQVTEMQIDVAIRMPPKGPIIECKYRVQITTYNKGVVNPLPC